MYLLALASSWLTGLRALSETRDPRLRGIHAAFLAALSGALVTGLLDHYFANQAFPHAVALFWLYAAALVAASYSRRAVFREAESERAASARATAFGAYRPTG